MKIVRDKRLEGGRRWTGAAGVAREEWMEEDEGEAREARGGRWVAHARVG